jgi:hypothetical protein
MKAKRLISFLSILVFILALAAALASLLVKTPGAPHQVTSLWGQPVTLEGSGLYKNDSVSYALQAKTQDVVTLVLGLPMLALSIWLYQQGGLRGKLLLAGTLANFFYIYIMMAVLAAFNPLFLVYVVLFSASLYGMILVLVSIDVPSLPASFSDKFPRRWTAGLMIGIGVFLVMAWLGRVLPPILQGSVPASIDIYSTLPVQALDMGLLAPAAIGGGLALWKKKPAGYLLAGVILVKAFSFGTAVAAMGISLIFSGAGESLALVIIFAVIALVNIFFTIRMLLSIEEKGVK